MPESLEKTTSEKLIELLKNKLPERCEGKNITEASRFDEDLEADSLDKLEFVSAVDETFKIETSMSLVGDFKTVRNYADYIDSYKK
jgi:acyl carrier protein